jgi:protein subunit release factor B
MKFITFPFTLKLYISSYSYNSLSNCNIIGNSNINRIHSIVTSRSIVTIREEDLIEKFVKGSGPGGQCINKLSNRVQLKHIPTGILVTCQEQRSH